MKRAAVLALALTAAAASAQPATLGTRVAHSADLLLGRRSLSEVTRAYPDDCSGFVRYVYASAGVTLLSASEGVTGDGGSVARQMYRRLRSSGEVRRRTARVGDLVFFRDTWDRNGDGRLNDGITHVGVVDAVGRDGSVSFVHRAHAGIVRSRLDLRHPHLRRDGASRVHNDVLRRAGPGKAALGAGDLLAGFASPRNRRKHSLQ